MHTNIIVNLQYESTHNWPECPFEEVAFLRDLHRHVFHICGKKKVEHNDRDIEIIMLKRNIIRWLGINYPKSLGRKSCEDLAEEISRQFQLDYCSVLEDGENGAEIWR